MPSIYTHSIYKPFAEQRQILHRASYHSQRSKVAISKSQQSHQDHRDNVTLEDHLYQAVTVLADVAQ